MLDATALSERRACRLAGLSRDAFRHPPEQAPATQALSARIIELAQMRRRFGYARAVRTDHGPEFTSRAFIAWTQQHGTNPTAVPFNPGLSQ